MESSRKFTLYDLVHKLNENKNPTPEHQLDRPLVNHQEVREPFLTVQDLRKDTEVMIPVEQPSRLSTLSIRTAFSPEYSKHNLC